jgi:filamentous hemagglutinin
MRPLIYILCFQLAVGPQLAAAQTAPTSAETSVTHSANDTTVINIAAPNAAGVSHNTYSSYNVGPDGLILNNSPNSAVSIIGGGVVANPNLAGGRSASLILNEVTSANPGSMLAGYQEIVGASAELVIANPWGITCNGCGFVNTPRVTLTTGTPSLSPQGALMGFTITGGRIAVAGNGLDATRQSALDLLARTIDIQGDVVVGSRSNGISGDLQLLAGANSFNYVTRTGTGISGSGAVPDLAID